MLQQFSGAPQMPHQEYRELNAEGFARQARAAELEGEIALLAAHINAATYRLIEMLREFDELKGWSGWPTPAHWLQWRCGYSLGATRERFRVARALPALPQIREAFRAGRLSFAQVRAVIRVATPENETTLLMWAQHATASQKDALDGWVAAEAAPTETRIAMIDDPPAHPDEDVSAETRRARRADALVRVAESYLEPDGRPRSLAEKYQVHVHLDLRRDADGPVVDPDAPALAEETIRRLGCEAGLVPVRHEGGYGLRVTDDGALVFTRPDGERIPDVPRPLVLTGDPVAVLVAGNHRHDVSAETFRCKWDSAPPDYGAMVQLLDKHSRPAAQK
jgi:hypothetical protein